jgi:hypothetical protein
MSAVLPMLTPHDAVRAATDEKNKDEPFYQFFQARCQALMDGIRVSRKGYVRANDVDYESLQDVVEYLLDKGWLGFFQHAEDGDCIGIRDQMGGCGPYIKGYCPLPNFP